MNAHTIITQLKTLADAKIAEHSQRFFKTGVGEYGEGDQFLGIRVPMLRKQVSQYKQVDLNELEKLLHSQYHEARLLALLILVKQFQRSDPIHQEAIYHLYLSNTAYVNNWDLVDTSAHPIVGAWLLERNRSPLLSLAKSESLWERRIAMISCYHFIKRNQFEDALVVASLLLNDDEDLIHKAVGWMLREVGNRDRNTEEDFLLQHYQSMPRTMLRYAIEKFESERRQAYLSGAL